MENTSALVLAADIGGTSGRFALFEREAGPEPVAQAILPTAAHGSFRDLLSAALDGLGRPEARAAVLAVAGPVERGLFCRAPNIAYSFDLDELPRGLLPGRSVLVNDFTAQAHGCRRLGEDCLGHAPPIRGLASGRECGPVLEVFPGRMDPSLTQAVVGPGTGLGKAALVPDGRGGFVVCGSEGGHAAFPFSGAREEDFQEFALEALGEPYVRVESLVSGPGLALVHRYLTGREAEAAEAAAALTFDSPVAAWFARFLGRACRDYVLEVLAVGGLYISGGVAAKNPELLSHEAFRAEFISNAKHADLLAKIPARLVTDELVGLRGAAALAWSLSARP